MSQGQFTPQEVEETQTVTKLRSHIERHLRRVKEFHLFDGTIPLSMVGSLNQILTAANMLPLFRAPPLLKTDLRETDLKGTLRPFVDASMLLSRTFHVTKKKIYHISML